MKRKIGWVLGLVFGVLLVGTSLRATPYTETFESYSVGTQLTDNPPNFFNWAQSGTFGLLPWSVENVGGSKTGQISSSAAGNYFSTYQGQSFTYTDYSATIRGTGTPSNTGIIFRATDGITGQYPNGYALVFTDATHLNVLKYLNHATVQTIATGSSVTYTAGSVFRVVASGTSIKCYYQGTLVYNLSDSTYASGKVGFATSENSIAGHGWDDLTVVFVAPATPTSTDTLTSTPTPTFTKTATSTITKTSTPTFTSTSTITKTGTPTFTITLTGTPTFTATLTGTPTFTSTITKTRTNSPSPTSTSTNSPSPTFTSTITTYLSATATLTRTPGPLVFEPLGKKVQIVGGDGTPVTSGVGAGTPIPAYSVNSSGQTATVVPTPATAAIVAQATAVQNLINLLTIGATCQTCTANVSIWALPGFSNSLQKYLNTIFNSDGTSITAQTPLSVSDTAGTAALNIIATAVASNGPMATAITTVVQGVIGINPMATAVAGVSTASKQDVVATAVATVSQQVAGINPMATTMATMTAKLPSALGGQPHNGSMAVNLAAITATGQSINGANQSDTFDFGGLTNISAELVSSSWVDGGGSKVLFWESLDGATWTPLDIFMDGTHQTNGINAATHAGKVLHFPFFNARYFNVSCTAITSGSFAPWVLASAAPAASQFAPDIISYNSGSQSNGNKAITAHAMQEKLVSAGSAGTATWAGDATAGMTITGSTLGTVAVSFYSPGASKKFHLLGYQITVSGLAAAASSPVTFSLQDSGTNIAGTQWAVDVPTSAPTLSNISQGVSTGWISLPDFGYTATTNANSLQLKSDKALTAGTVTVIALVTYQ